MGSVAPPHSWDPEDDLLLKNAMEAGASLESLAKGAVCFSRCFTIKELSDRWHSLLYDKDISETASNRMIEIELSASSDSKSNKFGSKEKKSSFRRRRIRSLQSHYYVMRKRIRNEPYPFEGIGFGALAENNNCNGHGELPQDEILFGNSVLRSQIGDHYQIQDAAFAIGQSVLSDVLRDAPDIAGNCDSFQMVSTETGTGDSHQDHMDPLEEKISGGVGRTRIYAHAEDITPMLVDEVDNPCEFTVEGSDGNRILEGITDYNCSDIHELNPSHQNDVKTDPLITFDLHGNRQQIICPTLEEHTMKLEDLHCDDSTSLHHLGFSSPLPDLPEWEVVQETSAIRNQGDFDEECKIAGSSPRDEDSKSLDLPRCDGIPNESTLEGQNCNPARGTEGGFCDISLNFTNDGSFFIDLDEKELMVKACLDGLNNFLMNSPIEPHNDSTQNLSDSKAMAIMSEYDAIQEKTCTGETKSEDIQSISACISGKHNVEKASCLLDVSSKIYEPSKGYVYCPLNTEDPEIPCNDHVFLPEIRSPISLDVGSDVAVLGSSSKTYVDELKPLNGTKEGEESYQHHIASPSKFAQAVTQVVSMSHTDQVKSDMLNGGSIPGASKIPRNELNPDVTAAVPTVVASKEGVHNVGAREPIISDMSLFPHPENPADGTFHGIQSTTDMHGDSELIIEGPSAILASAASHGIPILSEVISEDQLQPISSPEQEEKHSDTEDDVPSFSDVEAMILDMELFPYDEECLRYARREYRHLDTRKKIIRLELSTKSHLQRTIAFRGAFAIFYGHKLKYYLKKPEVFIGRSTEEIGVDIDLREEGRANKISRRQTIILMDGDGSFSLKNLGRFALVVNGKDLLKGQSCILRSGSLIEIRGMWFIFEVNPDSVRQFLLKNSMKEANGQSLNLYSFKRELS